MTVTFRPAIRESIGLIIGLAGPSGGGKTFTALRLATGMAGSNRFALIDTEAGRAQHYADLFAFDHGDLRPPFRPDAYTQAIKAADAADYPVIVVDSASHEHAGEGGILDWQEEELTRMAGQDWQKRDSCKMAAWVRPKMAHKQMVQQLLQVRAHLILCLRAEQKVEMKKVDGKMQVVPKTVLSGFSDWIPICEKNLLYELTTSLLLTPDKPGVPLPIKLQEQHKAFFPLDQPITEKSGELLAAWARGGLQPAPAIPEGVSTQALPTAAPPTDERAEIIAEIRQLFDRLKPTAKDWAAWKETYLGRPDADPRLSDLAALSDYVKFLRLRAGKAA